MSYSKIIFPAWLICKKGWIEKISKQSDLEWWSPGVLTQNSMNDFVIIDNARKIWCLDGVKLVSHVSFLGNLLNIIKGHPSLNEFDVSLEGRDQDVSFLREILLKWFLAKSKRSPLEVEKFKGDISGGVAEILDLVKKLVSQT